MAERAAEHVGAIARDVARDRDAAPRGVSGRAGLAAAPSDQIELAAGGIAADAAYPERPTVVGPLLIQLRWVAAAGQAGLLVVAWAVADVALPYAWMACLLATTALTNLALVTAGARVRIERWLPAILTLDALLLTGLLALSGGPHNPFTALYVVHVALAAVAAPRWGTAWMAILSGGLYAAMFRWHVPLPLWESHTHASGAGAHLLGMWLALATVAAAIAYFIGRLSLELATARAQAARSERLASLTTLAAGAAHELGSPLGTIAVAAREIERAATGELREDAELIRDEVDRCREILDRMSGAARQPAFTGEDAPLGHILEAVRRELGAGGQRVAIEAAPTVLSVRAPRLALEQALAILVRNALDADPDGPVQVGAALEEGALTLRIADRGPGIPEDTLARIGEPFFTTKSPGRGTGLGLFVVRLIAERLGGTLRVRSRRGSGTEVTLTIPHQGGAAER